MGQGRGGKSGKRFGTHEGNEIHEISESLGGKGTFLSGFFVESALCRESRGSSLSSSQSGLFRASRVWLFLCLFLVINGLCCFLGG